MTGHISEELPRLLTGEATREEVQSAAEHLRDCEDCKQDLVSAVVAHASLTSAQRFAPDVATRPADQSVQPAPSVPPAPLPDLSAVFAQVRAEADSDQPKARRARRPMLVAAAVAAGLVIGGAGTVLVQNVGDNSPSGRSVALSAFDTGTTSGKATVAKDGRMRLNAASLPSLDARHRYEVWLTNAERTRMQPVGWIGTDGKATLTVPANLMSGFSDIEVSVQQVDASTYTYSGTSVLRGSYA